MRVIDADALLARMRECERPYREDDGRSIWATGWAWSFIENAPTVDSVEHGEWRPIQIGKWHGLECSVCKVSRDVPCGNNGIPQWKYCPECGAKMMEDNT